MTDNWLLARPEVDLDEVRALARREYGVDGELTELGSQQDRNFLVRGADGAGMLVKIFHPTVDAFAVDLHIAASDRLRAEGLLAGGADDGIRRPHDADRLRRRAGRRVAASRSSTAAAVRHHRRRRRPGRGAGSWSPRSPTFSPEWMPRTPTATCSGARQRPRRRRATIDDLPEDRREQCLTAARRAAAELDAVAADLPRQVIHGDLTADNVMRDRRGRHWVIDLGDVATSWRAAELAMPRRPHGSHRRPRNRRPRGRGLRSARAPHRRGDRGALALVVLRARCSPSAGGASCASTRATTTRASGSSTNGRSSRARRGCRPPR
jgi:hypothetical protein